MTEASESASTGAEALGGPTAGGLLRAARERSGLHIAALAASIKVSPRKLEALEADRYGELPDMTFTRALAQTVCRVLKVDAEPVLAKLPQTGDRPNLAKVGGRLNAPFRPPAGDSRESPVLRLPIVWATLLILLGALVLAALPQRWMPWRDDGPEAPAPVAGAAAVADAAASAAVLPSSPLPALEIGAARTDDAAVPAPAALASSQPGAVSQLAADDRVASAAVAPRGDSLVVRTSAQSWVEVQDARGQTVLSRLVEKGEAVAVDGSLPLRVVIGNAAVTELMFRGQKIDLAASTRDNVARLQLP